MASMASISNAWKLGIFYTFLASNGFVYGLSPPPVNGTSVKVGYLWENPRQENVDTSEVVMDKKHLNSVLRLICDISPPLPNDEDHWETRDELVKWYKLSPKTEEVKSMRYWSSDMTKTAISFSSVALDTLGTYLCVYDGISAAIDVLVADVEVAKALKTASNLTELYTFVSYMKDKSGINGWKEQQHLLQPIGTIEYCPTEQNSHKAAKSVDQLYPMDIKIVAAMGDAFTLGLGARATSINGYFNEYRDISWRDPYSFFLQVVSRASMQDDILALAKFYLPVQK
ncbi:hypothetical protein ACROYT_G040238 [Oculina patagonica]